MNYSFKNILIVGAHYDDAELGAGGVAARFIKEGLKVYKITLTDTNVYSKTFNLNIDGDDTKNESKKACDVLGGVEEIPFSKSSYGELEYKKEIMQELENILLEYNIDTVFFHFKNDYQTDHIAAYKICSTAARHCKNLLMFQSNPYIITEAYYPNFFIDISDVVDMKRKALSCYNQNHNRGGNLFETSIDRNKIWGYGIGVKYAEGFMAIKVSF